MNSIRGMQQISINIPEGFFDWLCGLTDGDLGRRLKAAEGGVNPSGNFYIRRRSVYTPAYSFKFSIGLHIDDIAMLYFIQKTLGMGKVFTSKKVATFEVFGLKEIGKIIKVFTEHPAPFLFFNF